MNKKISKMKDCLERVWESGKIPRGCTPADMYAAVDVLKRVHGSGTADTFMENVKDLFQRFGFKCEATAVGWNISV